MPLLLLTGILLNFRQPRRLLFFVAIMLVDFFYSINYSIPDIDTYYLPFYLSTVLLAGQGISSMINESLRKGVAAILLLTAAVSIFLDYEKDDSFAEDLAYLFLVSAPQNSVVIIDNWDIYAPARYIQWERGFREDVVLVDFALLKRSWYVEKLLREYPEHFSSSAPYIANFVERVTPFEQRNEHDPQRIENAYREMIFAMVGYNIQMDRPVALFVDWAPLTERFQARSNGLYKVISNDYVHVLPAGLFDLPEIAELDERRSYLIELVGRSMAAGVARLQEMAATERAIELAVKLHQTDKTNINFIQNIAILNIYLQKYDESKRWFKMLESSIPPEKLQLVYDDLEKRKREKILEDERNGQ